VTRTFRQYQPGQIAVSAITASELEYGIGKSSNPERNRTRVEAFLLPFAMLAYDHKAAIVYGRIRATLEKSGLPIGPLDLMIAAHALSRNLILVTNNESEFNRVADLRVENWVG
jgi:tRNA(fMet)-specific endonuclease VapC